MIKKFIVLIMVVFTCNSFAQQGTSSPYSFYGLGSLKFKGTVENQSMGGISVYSDSIHLNLRNPASYAGSNLKFYNNEARPIKFTVGGSQSSVKLKTESANDNSNTTTFDYLALAVPLGKFGAGFGIIPYSSVGYKLQSIDADDVLRYKYRGEGGLNKVFVGVGYQLTKDLRLGVDTHYNFGNITNTNIAYGYNDEGEFLQYHSREVNRSDLGGLSFNFGIIYSKLIQDNLELTASATFSPASNLSSENERSFSSIAINEATDQDFAFYTIDIDLEAQNLKNTTLKIPAKSSIGVGVGNPRKWFAGIEYTLLKASQYTNRLVTIDNAVFEDASTISLGGFYIPRYDSFNNYLKRVVYRAGLRFENTGLIVNDQAIKEFGISFGMGLPVGRIFSNANVGVEIGKRGTTNANLVQENFINFQVSLSLNDRWFEKRKFN